MRAHIRLRSPNPAYNVFLADQEIAVDGDKVAPVTYEGRLFVFLHTMLLGGYQPGIKQEAYVYVDAGPIAEPA